MYITKDGEVIVAHDRSLKRLCGEDVLISDTNFHEFPKIMSSIRTGTPFRTYDLTDEDSEKFSTLREALEVCKDKMISIDIKGKGDEIKHKVCHLIQEFKREHITLWGSMSHSDHVRCAQICPDIP